MSTAFAERERDAADDAARAASFDHMDFYAKHSGLWHGPWCHLTRRRNKGEVLEVDAEGWHEDCYACGCYPDCSGPYPNY